MRPTLPFLSTLLAGAATLAAQSAVQLPPHADAVDGHHSHSLPFGVPGFRTQLLLDGVALAPNGALLTGLRFRVDRGSQPVSGTTVPNVTVQIGNTTTTIGNMSTSFAANTTSAPTTVFQGAVTLPSHAAANTAGPMPWDIVVTFATPWQTSASANVLVDITGGNLPNQTPVYWLDAVQGGGAATQFGVRGDNATGDNLLLGVSTANGASLDPRLLSPGHGIDFNSGLSFTQTPGVLALGIAPQPVPIDLGVIGAPTQTLYIDPLVLVPHAWQQSFIGWFSTYVLAVPLNPLLVGQLIYGQSAIFEPTTNQLGLVLSAAVEVRIGDQGEVLPLQQLDATDPTVADGVLLDFSFGIGQPQYGGVPVLVEGIFF